MMSIRVVLIAVRRSLIDGSVSSAGAEFVELLRGRNQLFSNFSGSFVVRGNHGHDLLHVIEPIGIRAEFHCGAFVARRVQGERSTVPVVTVA